MVQLVKFIFKPHFKFRAKQRGITLQLAQTIYNKAREKYYDNLREHHIAIAVIEFKGKTRRMMVVYDKINQTIEFITTHVIKEKEIENKVELGRWKYEQD